MDSRTEAIEGIEKTIGELAGIFQQLTTMISAHDSLVQRYLCCTIYITYVIYPHSTQNRSKRGFRGDQCGCRTTGVMEIHEFHLV